MININISPFLICQLTSCCTPKELGAIVHVEVIMFPKVVGLYSGGVNELDEIPEAAKETGREANGACSTILARLSLNLSSNMLMVCSCPKHSKLTEAKKFWFC